MDYRVFELPTNIQSIGKPMQVIVIKITWISLIFLDKITTNTLL